MTDTICIYHGNCADGFTAAWAVWRRFGDAIKYHAGFYGDSPPDVKGKRVIIVDFSYPASALRTMCESARSVIVLDHHKTAQANLEWMPKAIVLKDGKDNWHYHIGEDASLLENQGHPACAAWFDMEKSGARLAWEFFHPGKRLPEIVKYVEDRDLWRFKFYGTREIQAVIFSHKYNFTNWNDLEQRLCNAKENVISEGAAIERKHFKDLKELLAVTRRPMKIGGHVVAVANLPYTFASDAGHELCKSTALNAHPPGAPMDLTPFAAIYYDTPKGRIFSLRSIGDFDVSEIAKKYGGGGHRNAAGFTQSIGWEGE